MSNTYKINLSKEELKLSLSRTGGQGAKGDSVSNAEINSSGDLVITVSSGSGDVVNTYNLGSTLTSFSSISDVNLTSLSDNQILQYDSATSKWKNENISSLGLSNVVEDTTPELGGNLSLNSNDITGTGDINITGAVTLTGALTVGNSISVSGNIIPSSNVTYDLGSSSNRFKDLYLSGSTIELGNASISASGTTVVLPANSTISGSGSIMDFTTSVKDEDDFSSNSATHVPTQQSVKAYVDSQIQTKDELSELSGTLDDISDGSTYVKSTNDYTNAEKTKLSNIENNADVTDTANVTSAGAAMLTGATFTGDVTAPDFIGDLNGAVLFNAKNDEGATISKGQVVYIKGISGNLPTVGLADANDSSKMPAFGLALADASDNASIQIVTFGTLSSTKTDYTGWAVGDTLYVSTTPGTLTKTAPTGESSLLQNIGKVQRVHASSGSIKVGGAGRTNATPNLNNGNIFLGNSNNQAVSTSLSSVADLTTTTNVVSALTAGTNITIASDGTISSTDTNTTYTDATTSASGLMSASDKTKLDGVAASATANPNALDNISEDTSPQLGGNLDVNGKDIVTTSNGDIDLDPNGSGKVVFKGNSTKGSGQFVLNCENNSHGITIKGPPHSAGASYTLTLPNTDGNASDYLQTDGNGNLTWAAVSGGGGGISELSDDTTPQLGGDLDVGTHRIETTESQMNFEVDSDASSTGYEGYYFYGGPTTNGYNRIWITGTETALQQRVGSSTAYTAFIQNNNQYSVIINEHGGNHPAKITNWGNGSSAHLNIGVRHADAKVRFTDHTGSTLRYAFPNSTPSSGQVLTASDGSGTLSWADASGSDPDLYRDNASSATTPTASGTNAVAIGDDAVASGVASVAFGQQTDATGTNAIAIGSGAQATQPHAVAIRGTASARESTAIGVNNVANGAVAAGEGSMALQGSYASGTDSFAATIATNSSSYGATGANSIAMGYQAKATNTYSTSIGSLNNVTAYGGFGAGDNNAVSGDYGVAIGRQNTSGSTVSGRTNVALGYGNSATGGAAFAIGDRASTQGIYGKMAHSSGYGAGLGTAQSGEIVLYGATTDATPKKICSGAGSSNTANATNQVVLPNNSCYGFTGTVIAREDSSSTNDFAVWEVKGGAVRAGSASTTALGSYNINKISESTGAANWSIALSADTTNGAVAITVTGEASHNIRWVATINTTEVIY